MAININKCDEKIKKDIIADYKNNISMRALEEKYNVTRTSISKFLTELGIKTTVGNHYRKYTHDENFFEKIDIKKAAVTRLVSDYSVVKCRKLVRTRTIII